MVSLTFPSAYEFDVVFVALSPEFVPLVFPITVSCASVTYRLSVESGILAVVGEIFLITLPVVQLNQAKSQSETHPDGQTTSHVQLTTKSPLQSIELPLTVLILVQLTRVGCFQLKSIQSVDFRYPSCVESAATKVFCFQARAEARSV